MAALNRTTLFTRLYKALKKHYAVPEPLPQRPLLEQLLFACCLENAPFNKAQQAYQALVDSYFDWNEVRVSTVRELAETMHMLPEPAAAATHIKRLLQTVFEATYSFDLEPLRKLTLGEAQKKLREVNGVTPFVVAVATQGALGGHAIGVDRATWELFALLNLASEKERTAGTVPGLERAIPKNKGQEFFSLLHECAADLLLEGPPPRLLKALGDILPDARQRLEKFYAARHAPAEAAGERVSPVTDGAGQPMPHPLPEKPPAPVAAEATVPPQVQASNEAGKQPSAKARSGKPETPGTSTAPSEAERPAAKPEPQQAPTKRPAAKVPGEASRRKPPAKKERPVAPRTGTVEHERKAAKKNAASSSPTKRKPR